MAGFCELAASLQAPDLARSETKSPIVSGHIREYSRFRETATRDRVRSALRGGGPESFRPFLRRECWGNTGGSTDLHVWVTHESGARATLGRAVERFEVSRWLCQSGSLHCGLGLA